MQDSKGHNQTFNIDYPASETTLSSIRMALAPAIATNSWCSTYGSPFIRVKGATIVETEKTKLDEGGQAILIEPQSATINVLEGAIEGSQTFIVEGMTIQGYNYQFIKTEGFEPQYVKPNIQKTIINTEANTITATIEISGVGTAYYNFMITNGTYTFTIPIKITRG